MYEPTVVSEAAEKVTTPPANVLVMVPARAPPAGPVATLSVTEPVLRLDSLLPYASSAVTTIPSAAADATVEGTEDSATWAVAPGLTVKDPLVLLVRPGLEAVMVKLPDVSNTRLLKIAWPEPFVATDVVDEGSNVPELRATLTMTPAWATLLLPESRSWTTGAVIATPATTVVGLVVKASWVGEPAAPAGAAPITPSVPPSIPSARVTAKASDPVRNRGWVGTELDDDMDWLPLRNARCCSGPPVSARRDAHPDLRRTAPPQPDPRPRSAST